MVSEGPYLLKEKKKSEGEECKCEWSALICNVICKFIGNDGHLINLFLFLLSLVASAYNSC